MDGKIRRSRAAAAIAPRGGGVISRDELQAIGINGGDVKREVGAGRWRLHGSQTVALHTGPLSVEDDRWRTIWEVGRKIAAIDGVTALQAAGLRHFAEDDVHVSVVHTNSVRAVAGARLHKVIRRLPDEVVETGLPRTRPPVAALRAAYWARSDRQAALILLMTVQQRLAAPAQLLAWSGQLRGRKRRAFIKLVLADIADGVQSLGELDFARLCRSWGLPEPTRQVVRRGPRGRMYLDVRWAKEGVVVEIDGVQHREGLAVTVDNLSRNAVVLLGDRVLRIDVIGLRLHEGDFMRQVAAALGRPVPHSR